jgi:hypothetical protein
VPRFGYIRAVAAACAAPPGTRIGIEGLTVTMMLYAGSDKRRGEFHVLRKLRT